MNKTPVTVPLSFTSVLHVFVSDDELAAIQHAEGLTWIRGHHAQDSEEAQALLAAFALTKR